MTQVEIDSRRAADRLRPGGSTFLDTVARREIPGAGRSRDRDQEPPSRPTSAAPIRRSTGPGSRLGFAVVAFILAMVVLVALVVSLQAAF